MNLLVTGASGYLGRAIVASARRHGHDVVALVRPAASIDHLGWSTGVRVVRGDLRSPDFADQIADVDAVVHAAAGTSGDLASQFASSVVATENLLQVVDLGRLERFVHISSFSVYDFTRPDAGSIISASATPLETEPERRDAYTTTKLRQEGLVRQACAERDTPLVVLRPGVIFGEGNDWNFAGVGSVAGRDLVFAPSARFRLTYVENCAEAAVLAATAPDAVGACIDVVDDDLPTHAEYHRAAARAGAPVGATIPVPWWLLQAVGRTVDVVSRVFFAGRAKLPEMLELRRQEARWKPFEYENDEAKTLLGWTPTVAMDEAIERAARAAAS